MFPQLFLIPGNPPDRFCPRSYNLLHVQTPPGFDPPPRLTLPVPNSCLPPGQAVLPALPSQIKPGSPECLSADREIFHILYSSISQISLLCLKYRHTAIPANAMTKKRNAAPEPFPLPNIAARILSLLCPAIIGSNT